MAVLSRFGDKYEVGGYVSTFALVIAELAVWLEIKMSEAADKVFEVGMAEGEFGRGETKEINKDRGGALIIWDSGASVGEFEILSVELPPFVASVMDSIGSETNDGNVVDTVSIEVA
jgi:hypothetical protein